MATVNPVESNKNEIQILNASSTDDKHESLSKTNIAEELLKESDKYDCDSNSKKELARQYLHAAHALERLAVAVRLKAQQLKNGKITQEQAVNAVSKAVQEQLNFPVPKNATFELLEQIAKELDKKAKQNRDKSKDLMDEANKSSILSKQLRKQAEKIIQKEFNFSGIVLRSIISKNEGLKWVLEKLGVYKLDAQYKEQITYAEKKTQECLQKLG